MIKDKPEKELPKPLKTALYWCVLTFGVLLLAFNVYFFDAPNHFAMGGMGGLSIVLSSFITKNVEWLTQPVLLAMLNVFLLIIGLIFLGKSMTLKTLYCTLLYTFAVWFFSFFFPHTLPITATPDNPRGQPLLEVVYAVLLSGTASAIIFNCRASSGGSDIIALIFKKYTNVNIGIALMFADFGIACLSFLTDVGVEIALISLLGVFTKSFVIDGVIENITKTKYVTIITANPDKASEVILKHIHRGFTQVDGVGGYTGEPRTVILTVCRRAQAIRLKLLLREEDPDAFVIITDVNEIMGKGFSSKM